MTTKVRLSKMDRSVIERAFRLLAYGMGERYQIPTNAAQKATLERDVERICKARMRLR